jgi:regulator of cell morphogenesis and NO signaling
MFTLFSEKMKLADLLLTNYQLLDVFPRFGLGLGFGESTVKQMCDEKGLSASLFLLVCNLHTFNNYIPDTNTLAKVSLADLMCYLRNSHKNYIENRMPEIIARIFELIESHRVKNGKMLIGFCEKYKQEIITHFDYEEQIVFPYIEALLKGEKTDKYKIKEYERNHSDLDAALSDLKNILVKYLPAEFPIEMYRNVLIDLFLFEDDLSKHTLLEDRILISLVERIESSR